MFLLRNSKRVFILLSLLGASLSAYPWGDIGHGAVGYIAEKELTPEARKMVHQILGVEPLMVSAIFPDHVRSDSRFAAFAPFHFVEVPWGKSFDDVPVSQRAKQSANTIVSQVPNLLMSPTLSRDQKMILLRYLVHVVGDIHQPLHVGNGVDMGANLCDVRWTDPESGQLKDKNLHTVWDEGLISNIADEYVKASKTSTSGKRYFGDKELGDLVIRELGEETGKVAMAQAESMDWKNITAWYKESADLHSIVYPDGNIEPAKRTYCKVVNPETHKVENGVYDATTIPTLSPEYIKAVLPTVKKQVLLGGFRLAGILNRVARENRFRPIDSSMQAELLKEITLSEAQELSDVQILEK